MPLQTLSKRLLEFDVLKAIAIFLVIWQHTIFCSGYKFNMVDTLPGKFITLSNMPLFMFIVGYFSKSALFRRWSEMFKAKWNTLLLPMVIFCVIQIFIKIPSGNYFIASGLMGGGRFVLSNLIKAYWFIWAIMYSIIWLRLFNYIFQRSHNPILPGAISMGILLIIPRTVPIPHFSNFMALYIFFIGGVLFKHYELFSIINKHIKVILPLSVTAFILSLILFSKETCFYTFKDITGLAYIEGYLIMLFGGFSSIVLLYLLVRKLLQYHLFAKPLDGLADIGQYTLPIYMMQGVLCLIADLLSPIEFNLYILFGVSIIIFAALAIVCKFLACQPLAAKYLLGKTPSIRGKI